MADEKEEKRETRAEIKARLESQLAASGECFTWKGDTHKSGAPIIDVDGHTRRADVIAYEVGSGKKVTPGETLKLTCGTDHCLNWQHMNAGVHLPEKKEETKT